MTLSEDSAKITDSYTCPPCIVCGDASKIGITDKEAEGIQAWKAGALIQIALPDTSNEKRELIKSGIHPDCWEQMFAEDQAFEED